MGDMWWLDQLPHGGLGSPELGLDNSSGWRRSETWSQFLTWTRLASCDHV